ncbi:MAG: hypothetical protein ACYDBV_13510 [Nitrospiria bacterium]
MFNLWVKPLYFLLGFFGLSPLFVIEETPSPNEPAQEEVSPKETPEEEPLVINDDTDLLTLDQEVVDDILTREDIDPDRFLDAIKTLHNKKPEDQKVFVKDIKVKKDETPEPKENLKPVETPMPKEPDNTGKPFVVNDDLIGKKIEEFREKNKDAQNLDQMIQDYKQILTGVKGDQFTDRAFKNYVNSQLYIKSLKNPFDPNWKPDTKVVQSPDYLEMATKQKAQMLLNSIKQKYPDFPDDGLTNQESRLEFERILFSQNPVGAQKYVNEIDSLSQGIDKEFDRHYDIVTNWEKRAKDQIEADINLFKSYLETKGLTPEDVGIPDLSIDANYYNKFLFENVLQPQGKVNENVITFYQGRTPIIKPYMVHYYLRDLFDGAIQDKIAEKARAEGFRLGQSAVVEPSLSENQGLGIRENPDLDEKMLERDDLSLEDADSFLGKVKNRIIGKRK